MKYIFILLCVISVARVVGQTPDSLASTPRFAVKVTPLILANRFHTIQAGVEYRPIRTNPNWTVSHDIGIVIPTKTNTEYYSNKSGFRAITELRYYIIPTGRVPFYTSGEIYFHKFKYDRTELWGYDCAGDCSFYQYTSYRRTQTMQRAAIKLGFCVYIGDRKEVILDFSGGVAYRIRDGKDLNKPVAPANVSNFGSHTDWFEDRIDEDVVDLTPVLNIRAGYRFK